jgi:hypothetical protein
MAFLSRRARAGTSLYQPERSAHVGLSRAALANIPQDIGVALGLNTRLMTLLVHMQDADYDGVLA